MRHILFLLAVFVATACAFTQPRAASAQEDTLTRKERLKAALSQERGEITAMEALEGEGQGIVVGYSSGAVLNCLGENTCEEFSGTPNVAVERIAVSRRDPSDAVWVSYSQGALYKCVRSVCKRFNWTTSLED